MRAGLAARSSRRTSSRSTSNRSPPGMRLTRSFVAASSAAIRTSDALDEATASAAASRAARASAAPAAIASRRPASSSLVQGIDGTSLSVTVSRRAAGLETGAIAARVAWSSLPSTRSAGDDEFSRA